MLFASGQNLSAIALTLLVLNAYGAAMVGRLTSFPMTILGALALGLIQELTNVELAVSRRPVLPALSPGDPGLFLIAAVLFVPSFRLVGRPHWSAVTSPRCRRCAVRVLSGVALVAFVAVLAQSLPAEHVLTSCRRS